MFHLADFWIWLAGNQAGTTHVMIPGFDPRGVLQAIQQHRVSDMLLVPTMIQLLVDEPARTDHDLTSIRNIIYGAWAISEGVLSRATAAFEEAAFTQADGMTELAPIATMLLPSDHRDEILRHQPAAP